jgi:hypothetical protein
MVNHGCLEGSGKVVRFLGERLDGGSSTLSLASNLDESSATFPLVLISNQCSSTYSMRGQPSRTARSSDECGGGDVSCLHCYTVDNLVRRINSVVLDHGGDVVSLSECCDDEPGDIWLQIGKE